MKSTKTNPKLNVKLLRQVKRHILKEPKRLNMHAFVEPSTKAPCGTVACIAGWACLLSGMGKEKLEGPTWNSPVAKKAARLLGIPAENNLFYACYWPEPLYRRYDKVSRGGDRLGTKAVASVTADRIEHFIKTGE